MGIFDKIGDFFQSILGWDAGMDDQPRGVIINREAANVPVPVAYGQGIIESGNRDWFETDGTENRYLYMAVSLCMGEIESIDDIFFNGKPLNEFVKNDNNVVVSTWPNFANYDGDDGIVIRKYLGAPGQTADSMLMTQPRWTSDHFYGGIAYLAIRLKYNKKYLNGVPQVSAVGKWKKVRDPRDGGFRWSDNFALCRRDYVQSSVYGRGLPDAEIDDTSWNAAADDCETTEPVVGSQTIGVVSEILTVDNQDYLRFDSPGSDAFALGQSVLSSPGGNTGISGVAFNSNGWFGSPGGLYIPFTQTAGTFKVGETISALAELSLHKCNMTLNEDDKDRTVFENAELMRGEMRAFETKLGDGKYYLYIDKNRVPTFDIDQNHVLGGFSWALPGKDKRFNRVTMKFKDPNLRWKENRAIWPAPGSATEATLLAKDNGEPLHKEITLHSATDMYQATETARLYCLKSRNQLTCSFEGDPELIENIPGEVGTFTFPSMGWNSKLFQIMETGLADNGNVIYSLQEFEPAIFPYEAVPLDAIRDNTDLPDPMFVPQVTGVSLAAVGDILQDLVPRQLAIYIDVHFNRIDDDTLDRYQIRYRMKAGEDPAPPEDRPWSYVDMDQVSPTEDPQRYLADIAWLRTYEVQVRGVNDYGTPGDWSNSETIDIVRDDTPPDPTTISLVYTTPNSATVIFNRPSDIDYSHMRVFHNSTATPPAQPSADNVAGDRALVEGLSPGVKYYFWVAPVDDTGNVGDLSPHVSADTPYFQTSYYKSSPPVNGVDGVFREGDLWYHTGEGNNQYRWNGTIWVDVQDTAIGDAQQAADDAQQTADSKVITFYSATPPTAEAVGDLWFDIDDGNNQYRWNGTIWEDIQDTLIQAAYSAANDAQATADGKVVTFYATLPPTAEAVGDLWFETDDDDHPYRWSGSVWVSVRDGTIVEAQNTADQALDDANNITREQVLPGEIVAEHWVTLSGTTFNNPVNGAGSNTNLGGLTFTTKGPNLAVQCMIPVVVDKYAHNSTMTDVPFTRGSIILINNTTGSGTTFMSPSIFGALSLRDPPDGNGDSIFEGTISIMGSTDYSQAAAVSEGNSVRVNLRGEYWRGNNATLANFVTFVGPVFHIMEFNNT